MDGSVYMLAAYKSFRDFIGNNYRNIEANGRVRDSLWIIISCATLLLKVFCFPFFTRI